MADLMGVMLKSMGINGSEIMQTAGQMQAMVAEIHGMLKTITFQNELIITHLASTANLHSAIRDESCAILTKRLSDGTFADCTITGD